MDTPSVDPRTTTSVETLYRSHAAEIFRYALAMLGNRADAEDVTQATFVNAMRAIERHGEPRTPSNWLITIAHNIVRQRFRQQQARPTEVELASEIEAAQVEHGETSIDDLVRALQRIPPNQREALVMRELEGRPYREIAAMLDLSLGAVETLIFRARRSLAEELEQLVTCERAELALSQRNDGRLSRKDRRRLDEHLRECPSCAELAARQTRFQDAFKRLALLPVPAGLPSFGGTSGATLVAGAGAASVGAGATAVAGSTVGAGGSAVLVGGAAVKLAVVAAAIATAGGVGYRVEHPRHAPPPPPTRAQTQTASKPLRAATAPAPHVSTAVPHRRHAAAPAASAPAVIATVSEQPATTGAVQDSTDHRSDRSRTVQQALASGQQPAPASRSAQGSTQSADAPGRVKKADPGATAANPPARGTAGKPQQAASPSANPAASKPKGEPAANANPNATEQGNAKPKNEPKAKQAASPPPATTTVAATTPTTTPEPAAAPAPEAQANGQGNGHGQGAGSGQGKG